jgi:hypothetical protein
MRLFAAFFFILDFKWVFIIVLELLRAQVLMIITQVLIIIAHHADAFELLQYVCCIYLPIFFPIMQQLIT